MSLDTSPISDISSLECELVSKVMPVSFMCGYSSIPKVCESPTNNTLSFKLFLFFTAISFSQSNNNFSDVKEYIPNIIIDLKYASNDNFIEELNKIQFINDRVTNLEMETAIIDGMAKI